MNEPVFRDAKCEHCDVSDEEARTKAREDYQAKLIAAGDRRTIVRDDPNDGVLVTAVGKQRTMLLCAECRSYVKRDSLEDLPITTKRGPSARSSMMSGVGGGGPVVLSDSHVQWGTRKRGVR